MTGSQRPAAGRHPPRETPDGALETVRIWLLGGFRVSVGSSRSIGEDEWRLRKAASLIKLLALAQGHRVHRERAMDLLWPELDSRAAANNLHHALYVARRTLEPSAPAGAASGYLHLRDESLALSPAGPVWVDVEAFEEAATAARHGREGAAYRAAMDLYSGELLPQDRYEAWAEERRAQLRGVYLSLLLEAAGFYEGRKEFRAAVEALGRVVAEDPTHEEAHVGLIRLYALSGRRREALWQYERLRDALSRELGTEPDVPAVRLHEEIWAGTFPPVHSRPAAGSPSEDPPAAGAGGRHNLPLSRTSFIGREAERLEVKRLLGMTRLLTLTGVGGSGKTRLALAEAAGAGEAGRELNAARPAAWLKLMESEHANLRAALSWSLGRDDQSEDGRAARQLGLRLVVALWWFWHTHQTEGRSYLERALSTKSDPAMIRWRALASEAAAGLAPYRADYGASKGLMEEALALYPELGDEDGIAAGLTNLGLVGVLGELDDVDLTAVLGELKPRPENPNTLAYLLMLEGLTALSRGDPKRSVTLHEQSLELFREISNTQGIITCQGQLGLLALVRAITRAPPRCCGKACAWRGIGLQAEHPTLPLHAGVRDRLFGAAGSGLQAVGGRGRHGGGLRHTRHPHNPLSPTTRVT